MIKHKMRHLIIRVPKTTANLVYYLLESHEGLVFHSTLDETAPNGLTRDIEMTGSVTLMTEIDHLLYEIQSVTSMQILEDSYLDADFNQQANEP